MADAKSAADKVSCSKIIQYESNLLKMFEKIGSHLTPREVFFLKVMSGGSLDYSLRRRIRNGRDFLFALAKAGHCDESNFTSIIEFMKKIKRHDLLQMIHMRQKAKVSLDPVEEYLKNIDQDSKIKETAAESDHTLRKSGDDNKSHECGPSSSDGRITFLGSEPPLAKRLRRSQRISKQGDLTKDVKASPVVLHDLPKKYSCDVRLRVRAEYCNYHSILSGNVSSFKADPMEQRLDCFSQASAILRARDLGYIVCDIKFSEVTYLDAFWRDYLNGSLLEALKGVFITESLKQAVGNEAIKLLVNVDENDYEKGRLLLMKNLSESN